MTKHMTLKDYREQRLTALRTQKRELLDIAARCKAAAETNFDAHILREGSLMKVKRIERHIAQIEARMKEDDQA